LNLLRADFFWHARTLHGLLKGLGAEARVEMPALTVTVEGRGRRFELQPRFYVPDDGRWDYSAALDRKAAGFAGWLPYRDRRWPLGSKIAFKEYCLQHGLPTPPMWRTPAEGMSDFLVKLDRSAHARGIRGPFRSYSKDDPAQAPGAERRGPFRSYSKDDPAQAPGAERYYERFVPGRSVKAWFWEDRVAAIEMYEMPAVTGDGRSTLRELMERRARPGSTSFPWDRIEDLARFQDAALDEPLAEHRRILADIRFSSPLIPAQRDSGSTLERYRGSSLLGKLQVLGPLLWRGIPQDLRPATLFTVDAVLDANEDLWLLEMTCDPAVHPEAYRAMLGTCLPQAADAARPGVAPAGSAPDAEPLPRARRSTLEAYRDLIFSPLALPEPPAVDIARLLKWMAWARDEGRKRGLNVPEREYEARTGKEFPWLMANVHYGRRSHVEDSFDHEFASLAAYTRLFPLREKRLVVLLAQRGDVASHLHADSDGFWGFRFYLANRAPDALYFCPAHERLDELPQQWAGDWSRYVDVRHRRYARWPAGNPPFCLNSVRAAHAVESPACALGERIACLVMPREGIDEPRLLSLLEESSARFGDFQIWHPAAA
jgi:hypothetical protein